MGVMGAVDVRVGLGDADTAVLVTLVVIIDRRCLCSGRIHYKITLKVCLQDGHVLSSI